MCLGCLYIGRWSWRQTNIETNIFSGEKMQLEIYSCAWLVQTYIPVKLSKTEVLSQVVGPSNDLQTLLRNYGLQLTPTKPLSRSVLAQCFFFSLFSPRPLHLWHCFSLSSSLSHLLLFSTRGNTREVGGCERGRKSKIVGKSLPNNHALALIGEQ